MQGSTTWSGYVATSRTPMNFVSGAWKVPPVSCRQVATPETAVFWVGLDGWYDKTVEQGGTEAFCLGTTAVYTAWWEMFPTNHISQLFPVHPGDAMTATVSYKTGVFTITVKDVTTHRVAVVAQRCQATLACNRSSAEWIAEAPSFANTRAYLPPWAPMSFTAAATSIAANHSAISISGLVNFAVAMSGAHRLLAKPGALLSRGAQFADSVDGSELIRRGDRIRR